MSPDMVLDRVSGRSIPAGATLPTIGRYAVAERPGRSVEFWHAMPDLAFQASPDTVTMETVQSIGDRVAALTARCAPLTDFLDISPLVDDHAAQQVLSRQALEEAIEEHLPFLRAVCFRPAARLRSTDRLLPVARVRTITPHSIVRLAAHSEDWAALRPDGVRPDRVLSPEREVEIDLYENRIAAQLVDELSRYLTLRAAQIRGISGMFNDIQRYIDDITGRHWKTSLRLWALVDELSRRENWQARARLRLGEVDRLRAGVAALRASPVWAGVNRRVTLGRTLRSTNLLTDEERYRHVAELWRRLVALRSDSEAGKSAAQRIQRWCEGFVEYCWVLALRAFDEIGAIPDATVRIGDPVRYAIGDTSMTLRRDTGLGVFLVEQGTRTVLRIVPLPHPLTASRTSDAAAIELSQLAIAAPETPTVALHPGSQEERQDLSTAVRLRAFESPATPAPGHDGATLWPMPVSPVEIDSVIRLARALRWSVDQPRLTGYPYAVSCSPSMADDLVAGVGWLTRVSRGVAVGRIPAAYELGAAQTQVMAYRHETARFRRLGSNASELEQLWEHIERAVADTVSLTRCPRCEAQSLQPERALEPRGDSGFRASCDSCGASWESRACRVCGRHYPILEGATATAAGLPDGDWIDRQFGTDLLAAPCATRDRVFLCSWCATCGNSQAEPSCVRCSTRRDG